MGQPLICMTLTGKTIEEDIKLSQKYEKFCDVLELRADHLDENEQLLIRKFPALVKKPCILTIRRDSDGGLWTGNDFSRTNLFGRALAFADPDKKRNFAYVDFEEDYHIPSIQDAAMAFGVRIIRSCHNMTEPIHNLRKRCDAMRKTGYEIPKIAFMPKTLSDVVNLFHESSLMTNYDHILVAMGAEGMPSRILTSISNSYMTYTSPQETADKTASIGHIDPVVLNDLYNFKGISKSTQLFGITGWPLVKTSSPEIHNMGYRHHGIDAVYFPIRSQLISESLNFAEQLDVKGMSVTIPFKESVLYYLHELSPEVMQIGACNTVVRKNYKWIGYNTDCTGFERALLEFLGSNVKTKKMKVSIIGAGGAAKAIAYTVKKLGMKACIFNRTLETAQKLAEKYDFMAAKLDETSAMILDEYSSLIIQTTSVGMNAEGPISPENDPIYFYKFRGTEKVFDIVYVPASTPVMRRASAAGCKVCNGYKMLEYQAYEQFKLFTGVDY
ncbi:Shikimate 5-dehydrogenase [Treponema sp. JC4]|uniref:type I 3-dehydroquinate dehydratase n=1 Tax=Treponema sp. JC4 TaxID=1124982 RepID=UPI00025B0227|nr:type I 3-dehydroquinate dehydratase [Treponema sp. JC4]EID86110.1 Shikimate 5-dehydrogenase [Treponema sp. JC4]